MATTLKQARSGSNCLLLRTIKTTLLATNGRRGLYSIAAFLGGRLHGDQGGLLGATVSLLAIVLPGFLLVSGVLPFWQTLSARDGTARMLAGVNAVVVGLLAAALYDPLWVSAVHDSKDFATALIAFVLLVGARWPSWAAVLWCVLSTQIQVAWQ